MKLGTGVAVTNLQTIGSPGGASSNLYFTNDAKTNQYYTDDAHQNKYKTNGGVLSLESLVPGLAMWHKADDPSTVQTGIVSSVGSGLNVTQWTDKTSNSYNAVNAITATQPVYGTSTINGLPAIEFASIGGSRSLALPAGTFNFSTGDMTFHCVVKKSAAGNQPILFGQQGSSAFFGIVLTGTGGAQFSAGGATSFQTFTVGASNSGPLVLSMVKSGTTLRCYRDGGLVGSFTVSNALITSLSYGGNLVGSIGECSVYRRAITQSELDTVDGYYKRWIPVTTPSLKNRSTMVTFGDSITQGTGTSSAPNTYTSLLAAALSLTATNQGIAGTPLQDSPTNGPGPPISGNGYGRYVAALTGAGKKDLCVIMYGTNDLGFQTQTSFSLATYVSEYQTIITTLLSSGYGVNDIVLCSPPWIPDDGYNYGGMFMGANRQIHEQYVAAVRQLASSNGLWYADTYAAVRDNGGYAALDTDKLHPNDRGHRALADYILRCTKV